jgi:hypothetical protein
MSPKLVPWIKWSLYALIWILLLANLFIDWQTRGWISPVSIFVLLGLVAVPFTNKVPTPVTWTIFGVLIALTIVLLSGCSSPQSTPPTAATVPSPASLPSPTAVRR